MSISFVHVPPLITYCKPYTRPGSRGLLMPQSLGQGNRASMVTLPFATCIREQTGPLTPVCHIIKKVQKNSDLLLYIECALPAQ